MNKIIISKQLLERMPFAFLLISSEYRIKELNPFFKDYLGYSGDDALIGKSIYDVLPPEEQHQFLNFIQRLNQGISSHPWEMFHLIDVNGFKHRFLINGVMNSYEKWPEKTFLFIGVPDNKHSIKEQHYQDNKFSSSKFSENKYHFLFKNAPIGMAFLDNNGYFEETNAAFIDHIGGAEILNIKKHFTEILDEQASEKFRKLADILEKNEQSYVKDIISFKGSGDQRRLFEVTLLELYGSNNDIANSFLFTEDITHQQDSHVALLQSEKLALTGRLAASLAHEINNPLQTSLGCLGLVEEMLDEDDDELEVYINLAIEELQRSARIVKKLRDLNRSTDISERTYVDLSEMIEGVLVLTKNQLHDRNIVPVFPYQGPPPVISVSRDQIQQVLLNLVMNAIYELPNGGKIYLDLILSEDPRGVTIKIRDTGNGIDPEIANQIFEPFISTKEEGIGLGLYICKQIIENHSGSLSFESEPGKGTEFSIWIPDEEPDQKKDK